MAYLNRRDAWLYGMRVDPGCKGQGIATRLTEALFEIARRSGRTWIGLDTLNHPRKAPVFRITEKLGMKLEGIYATASFRDLPEPRGGPVVTWPSGQVKHKAPKTVPGISPAACRRPLATDRRTPTTGQWSGGQPVMFHEQYPRWLWSRIGLARGVVLPDGTPAQVVRRRYGPPAGRAGGRLRTSVNLLAEPADLTATLAGLLKFAAGRGRSLVINYPAGWTARIRAAARRLKVPTAKRFFVAWRIYGRRL